MERQFRFSRGRFLRLLLVYFFAQDKLIGCIANVGLKG